ncbi:MAG: ABC-F family ATP-binding cassette domain-containing protein [Chloroflexi bacterium]|nr:ABC-F family ATP-binding cassette domain-containing protein [Chloroflexota bacterium]
MLQIRDITKWFGDVQVLDRINFNLNRGDRAGLIGPNGCGKTTLLRILTGELTPDRGSVQLAPASLRAGYLPQALDFPAGATVADVLAAAQGEREAAETRLARLAEAVAAAQGAALNVALAEYDRGVAEFNTLGGARLRADADAVLAGLGMADVDQARLVASLSGGQKTRLGLARLLLQEPDLLLLDEPTNHLDIVALAWLEEYLSAYRGAVLIVSHDRTFLDRTVNRILALDDVTHTLAEYAGAYTDYALAIDQRQEKQWAAYREQQERFRKLEASIRKLNSQAKGIEQETIHFHWRRIAKDLARHAVVQRARLERMMAAEDAVEKPGLTWKMKLEFADAPRSGQDVLHVAGLRMGYGDRVLFDDVSLHLAYGERAVLVGPNGIGKTTLLRCIAGQIKPWAGEIRLGRGVRLGYMAQEQETLDATATPLELIRSAAPLDETEARSFLHYFLFAGDEVFVPAGRLSFGERSRLALALLAVRGCNFLLLDEPINHLDIPSRESFERAMARFEGTVLAVVHDRYFIERLATTVWVMEGGQVRVESG